MKKPTLEQVNKVVGELIEAKTEKHLNEQIVEAAMTLTFADCGKLYLFDKDHFKRVYYSCELIKPNALALNKKFTKFLSRQSIFTLTREEIEKMQDKQLPREIKFLVI